MLNKIDSNVDRAAKIINHMRQFARKSEIDLEKVQVNEVLQNAFEIFSQQLKLKGIKVVWDIEKDLPRINADASRLEQVFINLLLNARDAIEEKWGSREDGQMDKRIVLKTKFDRPFVVCKVCDTGKGVDRSIADKIFDPFFTTKEVGKGTGLGLSISYGIIKDCGGSIRVADHKPGGACFILKFAGSEKSHGK
jgi:histidine kinase